MRLQAGRLLVRRKAGRRLLKKGDAEEFVERRRRRSLRWRLRRLKRRLRRQPKR